MTYLAGGHEMGFCTPSSGNVHESTETGSYRHLATSRCSLAIGVIGDTTSYAEWNLASTTTTPNIGFMSHNATPGFGGEYDWIYFIDAAGTVQAKITCIRKDGTGSLDTWLTPWYKSGSSWINTIGRVMVNMNLLKIDPVARPLGLGPYPAFRVEDPASSTPAPWTSRAYRRSRRCASCRSTGPTTSPR
jgi:hypothetical protein